MINFVNSLDLISIMKIISYNIHHCSQSKVDKLLSLGADLYIVPELSDIDHVTLPSSYSMFWIGDNSNKKKGLGVIYNTIYNCKIADWYNSVHEYILPFWCDDILILAIWPTKTKKNKEKSYPQITIDAIEDYVKHFKNNKVFICGDFNCYVGQSGENSKYSIAKVFELLNIHNLKSLYHTTTKEKLGEELIPTFYYRFNKCSPFFIDYAFSNFEVKSFEILKWDRAMSDHCALVAQF